MQVGVCAKRSISVTPVRKRALSRRVKTIQATEGRNYQTIFGTQKPHQVSISELIGSNGGEARFVCPYFASQSSNDVSSLPLLVYVPGIDGTGLGAEQQLKTLSKGFQIESFLIPFQDTNNFQQLLELFNDYMKEMVQPQAHKRTIYLLGESFGALLAIAAAHTCKEFVDRLILINPATGYRTSIWSNFAPLLPTIPKPFYPLVSSFMAPLVINPVDMLLKRAGLTTSFTEQASQIINIGQEMVGTLDFIEDYVTDDILSWKLEVVDQGLQHIAPYLEKIQQKTLILAAERDLLLPSVQEAKRLQRLMRATVKVLAGRSHAFMEDSDVDLLSIIKEEGFYIRERQMTSTKAGGTGNRLSLNNYGMAAPVDVPTKTEMKQISRLVDQTNQLCSPVFFSTSLDGQVSEGLHLFPESKPLIVVGNHVLMGLDLNILLHKLLEEKGILLRGLAHPAVTTINNNSKAERENPTIGTRILSDVFDPRYIYKLYTTYGAVPVSASNFHRLLDLGERVLLYPGGALEALKLRDEKYQVIWPDRAEFIRMAAKFEATIVTLASVGAEDGVEQLFDCREMLDGPFGDTFRESALDVPKARNGVALSSPDFQDEPLAPAIMFPKKPPRYYFLFGKPMTMKKEDSKNREKCLVMYHQVREELETNISYLIERREQDPYKDFEKRFLYEQLNQKQAPTFNPRTIV